MSLPYVITLPSGDIRNPGPTGIVISNIRKIVKNERDDNQSMVFLTDGSFNFIAMPVLDVIKAINEFLDEVPQ
jgi:hypothetical protein